MFNNTCSINHMTASMYSAHHFDDQDVLIRTLHNDMALLCYMNLHCQSTWTLKSRGSPLQHLSVTFVAFLKLTQIAFEDAVTAEEKRLMVAELHEVDGWSDHLKQINHFSTQTQKYFILFLQEAQNNFFTILGISQKFESEYKRSQRLVQSLRVVNNLAESEVAFDTRIQLKFESRWRTETVSHPSHWGRQKTIFNIN